MKLLYRGTPICIITDRQSDGLGFCAYISLLSEGEKYKPFFDWLIDEKRNQENPPPFDQALFEGWDVEDEDGVRHDIMIPCIDNNYTTLEWRQ